jgi:hypothetical protein
MIRNKVLDLFGLVKQRSLWLNTSVGHFRTSIGQGFYEYCLLPYCFKYKKDFFRNTLWEVLDDPAPIETILQFIRKYGPIPETLLMRIYFYEAKKKRRTYKSIERVMTRRIRQIRQHSQKIRTYKPTDVFPQLWGRFAE